MHNFFYERCVGLNVSDFVTVLTWYLTRTLFVYHVLMIYSKWKLFWDIQWAITFKIMIPLSLFCIYTWSGHFMNDSHNWQTETWIHSNDAETDLRLWDCCSPKWNCSLLFQKNWQKAHCRHFVGLTRTINYSDVSLLLDSLFQFEVHVWGFYHKRAHSYWNERDIQ